MPIARIDHVNIRTTDLEATVTFFRDVLGMEPRPAPGAAADQARWMHDAGGLPAVHIGRAELPYPTDHWRAPVSEASAKAGWPTGPVHHVALNCEDYAGMKARIASHGCETAESHIPEIGLRQIFVEEANGLMLELNFWGD